MSSLVDPDLHHFGNSDPNPDQSGLAKWLERLTASAEVATDQHQIKKPDPDPDQHQREMPDPDPDPRQVKSSIRIRIRNTAG
jgi:hypothetical protein